MIRMPRRSVTRFFIPLIDVLILLFCIFLLMPIVEEGAEGPGHSKLTAGEAEQLRLEIARQRKRIAELEQTRPSTRMHEASRSVTERLVIRTFQFDPKSGNLVYYDPARVEVRNQAEALALADRDRQAIMDSNRELYYLVMAPRDNPLRPDREERQKIQRWFKGVPVAWDIPRRGLRGVK